MKKKYGKKPIGSTAGSDIVESLKADPALTAFSFDGPYPVRDMADLLDNLYCLDNGRYYETPVDFYGLAKAPRQSAWHESALYFKRNVLTGCFIPHKLLNRQTFSAFALDWFTFGNAYLELPRNRLAARFLQTLSCEVHPAWEHRSRSILVYPALERRAHVQIRNGLSRSEP